MTRRIAWALLALLALLSARRVPVFRSDLALWTEGVATAPCLVRPHLELTKAAASAGQPRLVLEQWAIVQQLATGGGCRR